jgi:hypothetical protein
VTQNFRKKNVFIMFFGFFLIFLIRDYQLTLRDQPKYARFKGAEDNSISSIDSNF